MSADFQAILLGFFGQEIVAHSATLFAALTGAFFFVHYFRPQNWSHWAWRILFSLIAALLVTGAIYSGFRILCYGQLAYFVYGVPSLDVSEYCSLSQYYLAIIGRASERASLGNWFNNGFYRLSWMFCFAQSMAWQLVAGIGIVLAGVTYCLVSFLGLPQHLLVSMGPIRIRILAWSAVLVGIVSGIAEEVAVRFWSDIAPWYAPLVSVVSVVLILFWSFQKTKCVSELWLTRQVSKRGHLEWIVVTLLFGFLMSSMIWNTSALLR